MPELNRGAGSMAQHACTVMEQRKDMLPILARLHPWLLLLLL